MSEGKDNHSDEGAESSSRNFIENLIDEDRASGRFDGKVHTRFPPEPNGHLHIGHVKAINVNFGMAKEYGGVCNLRFDDTNPTRENVEYVESMKKDIRWLGFDWEDRLFFASDYFEQLYEWAIRLIEMGKAFVCDQTGEEMRESRGTLTEPGTNSPFRDRTVEENLDLFRRMREGEFEDGVKTLRAKVDMASTNLTLRDPVMYRIMHATHHRTGDSWCIYPMYDWAHGQSDSIEGITHSICTLEFENHRPLYDWYLEGIGEHHPQQIEFARLNVTYTIMSKRKLLRLVEEGYVSGWDDPRMPTIAGIRRRGYTPESLRAFCERIGVTRINSSIDFSWVEDAVRFDLNRTAERRMAVLRPLKVVVENLPADQVIEVDAINNPEDPDAGSRKVSFGREIYIERDDFMEDPPKKFFRLAPGREVRLRYAFFLKCNEVVKDDSGEVVELRCSYDPETLGGQAPDGRKVRGTIHWVSAAHACTGTVNLYDHLFKTPYPDDVEEGADFISNLNPNSLEVVADAQLESSLGQVGKGTRVQFERLGYFIVDREAAGDDGPVFNRTATLRDTWAKVQKKGGGPKKKG